MISHEKKIVFVHIPKTGGKCLSQFLLPYCDADSLKFSPYGEGKNCELHATVTDYAKHYGQRILTDYTFFTVVRNPFDKALSMALHQNNNTFDRSKFRSIVRTPRNYGLWPHSHIHFLLCPIKMTPQMYINLGHSAESSEEPIIDGFPKQSTPQHFNNLKSLMHPTTLLRFERYSEDLSCFFDQHGIKYDKELLNTKTNTTDHQHYSKYYGPVERAEIEYVCGFDLQWLDYKFEGEPK